MLIVSDVDFTLLHAAYPPVHRRPLCVSVSSGIGTPIGERLSPSFSCCSPEF
jgi:hypothetical protein